MKILICYFSQTGNTEAVAKSIAEGLEGQDVTITPAKDVDKSSLNSYHVVFMGSGVYAGAVSKVVNKLIKENPDLPGKIVLFCTHTNPDSNFYGKAFKRIEKQVAKTESKIIAKFDCIGENRNPQVVEVLLKTAPSMSAGIEAAKGHPDTKDLENAKMFAKSVLEKL